ncbi:TPA: hypothetical protein ACHFN2_002567 [Enterobacter hormaechei]
MIFEYIKQHSEVIISGFSVAAAVASAWAAIASRQTAAKALKIQSRMSLYELLKSIAEKANSHSKGKKGAEWNFYDAANIVRCLSMAMENIKNHTETNDGLDIRELKQFFISQLNMELFEELNYHFGPDALFATREVTSMTNELYLSWIKIISFFNFLVVTNEDLDN